MSTPRSHSFSPASFVLGLITTPLIVIIGFALHRPAERRSLFQDIQGSRVGPATTTDDLDGLEPRTWMRIDLPSGHYEMVTSDERGYIVTLYLHNDRAFAAQALADDVTQPWLFVDVPTMTRFIEECAAQDAHAVDEAT
jgi:hypothetical protein